MECGAAATALPTSLYPGCNEVAAPFYLYGLVGFPLVGLLVGGLVDCFLQCAAQGPMMAAGLQTQQRILKHMSLGIPMCHLYSCWPWGFGFEASHHQPLLTETLELTRFPHMCSRQVLFPSCQPMRLDS